MGGASGRVFWSLCVHCPAHSLTAPVLGKRLLKKCAAENRVSSCPRAILPLPPALRGWAGGKKRRTLNFVTDTNALREVIGREQRRPPWLLPAPCLGRGLVEPVRQTE